MNKAMLKTMWESELRSGHRWGKTKSFEELDNSALYKSWNDIPELTDSLEKLTLQIVSLEICNWRLLEFIPKLEDAIESMTPLPGEIGHGTSLTNERRQKIWAYWFSMRDQIARFNIDTYQDTRISFMPMLELVDPDLEIYQKVFSMIGEMNKNKEQLLGLFCDRLLDKLSGDYKDSYEWVRFGPRIPEIDRIRSIWKDNDPQFKTAIMEGGLEFCHHKLFRRLDIIISSIGAEKWRGAIPFDGAQGLTLNEEIDKALAPTIKKINEKLDDGFSPFSEAVNSSEKLFLRLLLVSLIESQQERAERIVKRNMKRSANDT